MALTSFIIGLIGAIALLASNEDYRRELILLSVVAGYPSALLAYSSLFRSIEKAGTFPLSRLWRFWVPAIAVLNSVAWITVAFLYIVTSSHIGVAVVLECALLVAIFRSGAKQPVLQ